MKSTEQEKTEIYRSILPQAKALLANEKDLIANMANLSAILKYSFHFLWVGFYTVKEGGLVLGPFQGPVACTRIGYGKGVCGTAWKNKETLIVPNVGEFPGHIACNPESRSEIVIPFERKEFAGVLDIDSDCMDGFDRTDEFYLKQILGFII